LNLTTTIKLVSSLPAHPVIRCAASAGLVVKVTQNIGGTVQSVGEVTSAGSGESVDATISGESATCHFTIPYSWTVPADDAAISTAQPVTYTVEGISAAVTVTSVVLGSDQSVVRTLRNTLVSADSKAAPAQDNGITTLTASTVL
jgi:hypothetical protein